MKDFTEIYISPNRTNLRISVHKSDKDKLHEQLDWLVEVTKQMNVLTPKTVIFCNTLKEIAIVVNHLITKLGDFAYHPATSDEKANLLIGIFHSASWAHNKQSILNSLMENGLKRIVVASTALSMGVNIQDIRYKFNWGPAGTSLDNIKKLGAGWERRCPITCHCYLSW